ncbi:hypothetical protein Pelo_9473 [Pelomyxa schiedti]|nr:hypothetical protein Pelo_9473 [Pelomyxa schiedti]
MTYLSQCERTLSYHAHGVLPAKTGGATTPSRHFRLSATCSSAGFWTSSSNFRRATLPCLSGLCRYGFRWFFILHRWYVNFRRATLPCLSGLCRSFPNISSSSVTPGTVLVAGFCRDILPLGAVSFCILGAVSFGMASSSKSLALILGPQTSHAFRASSLDDQELSSESNLHLNSLVVEKESPIAGLVWNEISPSTPCISTIRRIHSWGRSF